MYLGFCVKFCVYIREMRLQVLVNKTPGKHTSTCTKLKPSSNLKIHPLKANNQPFPLNLSSALLRNNYMRYKHFHYQKLATLKLPWNYIAASGNYGPRKSRQITSYHGRGKRPQICLTLYLCVHGENNCCKCYKGTNEQLLSYIDENSLYSCCSLFSLWANMFHMQVLSMFDKNLSDTTTLAT